MRLIIDRRLQSCTDSELAEHWRELAWVLQAKVIPETGSLPLRYQEAYERVEAEFARRGVQLVLF